MSEVVQLTEDLEPAYREFVPNDAVTGLYATLEFRNFLLQCVGGKPVYLAAVDGGRIRGALPMFVTEHPRWGRVINSLPWYGSHGGCVLTDPMDHATRDALLRSAAALGGAADVAFRTVILSHAETAFSEQYRERLKPDVVDVRTGQVTQLPGDGAELEARLEKCLLQKTRNLARKALRQGFSLEDGDTDAGWEYLVTTHHENLAALGGKAKPRSHFEAIRTSFPAAWRRLLMARLDGIPVAAMLLLRFGRTVDYITPVISHAYRSRQPLSFLIWHGMLDAVRSGFQWWNWGGTWTSQESLFHFKAGWGAQSWPYHYLSAARPDARAALQSDGGVMDAVPYYFLFPLQRNG